MNSPEIVLGAVSYPVPDLTIEQLRIVFPAIMRWQASLLKPETFTENNYEDLLIAVYHGAVLRNKPELKFQDFKKLSIPHYELIAALELVQRQTHLFRPRREDEKLGEAKVSPTGMV